jgi:hypothetical protein
MLTHSINKKKNLRLNNNNNSSGSKAQPANYLKTGEYATQVLVLKKNLRLKTNNMWVENREIVFA